MPQCIGIQTVFEGEAFTRRIAEELFVAIGKGVGMAEMQVRTAILTLPI